MKINVTVTDIGSMSIPELELLRAEILKYLSWCEDRQMRRLLAEVEQRIDEMENQELVKEY